MIYFDNASTTSVIREAADVAIKAMCGEFGNPSSLHAMGISAELEVKKARLAIADVLGCDGDEIVFTSCGTESNNLAIFGAAERSGRRRHMITTSFEHPSVLNAAKKLEERGYDVTYVEPRADGLVHAEDVATAVRDDTFLVSVMSVNNEVGSVMDIRAIASAVRAKKSDVLIHTDAVQAFLKLPMNVNRLGVDIISVSGHKIHAPKGVGALYIRRGVRLAPQLCGGGQERGMRSGTESVPLIAAFGEAVKRASESCMSDMERISHLRKKISDGIECLENAHVIQPQNPAPHIISVAFTKYPSEVSMRILEESGIYVSSGSACSRGKKSHVMRALRVSDKLLGSIVRISLSRFSTEAEAEAFLEVVKNKLV